MYCTMFKKMCTSHVYEKMWSSRRNGDQVLKDEETVLDEPYQCYYITDRYIRVLCICNFRKKKSSLSVGLIIASLNPILFTVTVYRYFIIYYKLNYSMNVFISLGFIVIRHYFIHRTEEFYHRCHIAWLYMIINVHRCDRY